MMKKMIAAAVITVMTMSAALPVFAAAPAQGYGRGRQQQPAAVAVQECITQDDALAIAMKHAGVTEKDVTWPRVHMDFDDGWQIYEVEFHVGWTEYNYDIDAVSGQILSFGTTVCYASMYYPDIIDKSHAYKAAEWHFGRHPYHNYSLVAAVGAARPKEVFYGNNRADFSAIPGNVAPGLLFRHPDHFENYDDWPFFWGQNEGTIAGNISYLIFGSAFKNLVTE